MKEKKPINIRVGTNIQRLREERHYTQEALSEKLGVTPNHLSAIERGVSGISLELMEKLCEVLSVTADHILFGRTAAETNGDKLLEMLQGISDGQAELLKLEENIQTLTDKLNEMRK